MHLVNLHGTAVLLVVAFQLRPNILSRCWSVADSVTFSDSMKDCNFFLRICKSAAISFALEVEIWMVSNL